MSRDVIPTAPLVRGPLLNPSSQAQRPRIVAVDGPAGSGKSSICYRVCSAIGWTYVNTGALYRAVGLIAVRLGVPLVDEVAVARMVGDIEGRLRWSSEDRSLWFDDVNLTPELGSEEAGSAASKVAKQELVRHALLPVQKQLTLAAPIGALVDGRDIGTVVFPDADLKIFLTASLEERSRRRLAQLGRRPDDIETAELDDVMRGIARRDERDEGRSAAPLKCADDAIIVDSSRMDVGETVDTIVRHMRAHGLVP
jgi:cytidylate kinase